MILYTVISEYKFLGIFMDILKRTFLFALLLLSNNYTLLADNAYAHDPFNIQAAKPLKKVSDVEFDAIVSNPWGNLSFSDKEKIGLYLFDNLQKKTLKQTINVCAKISKYKDYLKDLSGFVPALTLTPTKKHMIRYPGAVKNLIEQGKFSYDIDHLTFDPAVIHPIAEKMYAKTQELEENGYAVFFHGHRWALTLLHRLYKDLYQAYYGVTIPADFTFIHLKKPNRFYNAQDEENHRNQILSSMNGWDNASDALFMNKPLFGNINFAYSNSFYFFAQNYNEGIAYGVPRIVDIFSYFNADLLYRKYAQELIALETLHANASRYGNLFAIAIPKNMVKQCVFKTRDNNKDEREYCLVMTHDIALNPDSGIKVFAFNNPDPDAYAQFAAAYDALITRITHDLTTKNFNINPAATPKKNAVTKKQQRKRPLRGGQWH
jgi:hypothetical protein